MKKATLSMLLPCRKTSTVTGQQPDVVSVMSKDLAIDLPMSRQTLMHHEAGRSVEIGHTSAYDARLVLEA